MEEGQSKENVLIGTESLSGHLDCRQGNWEVWQIIQQQDYTTKLELRRVVHFNCQKTFINCLLCSKI